MSAPKSKPRKKPENLPAPVEPAVLVEIGDAEVEELIDTIRGMKRDASLMFFMAVGHLIVERFYNGELAAWRRIGPKDTSFRKLAARLAAEDGLGLDATALCRAVGVHELVNTLRDGIATSQFLHVGHYVAVLGLPLKTAERILRTADAERWTVARVRTETAKHRKVGSRGPTPKLPFVKGIQRFQSLLDRGDELFDGLDRVDGLPPEQVDALFGTLMRMGDEVERLKDALRAKTSTYVVNTRRVE